MGKLVDEEALNTKRKIL